MGCDDDIRTYGFNVYYFNPRSPNGLRHYRKLAIAKDFIFQSTQPEWAATRYSRTVIWILSFQSTQPEWAATYKELIHYAGFLISIHAARMGCDVKVCVSLDTRIQFQSTQPEWAATTNYERVRDGDIISIHAARMGCDCRG